jgi:hypothetical protein
MLCPENGNKDFDDLDCRDCKWYYQCFKMEQNGNIWGEQEPTGDNFPIINNQDKEILERHKQYQIDNSEKNKEIINAEQEIRGSIKMIGDYSTWEMIEAVKDCKLRLRFRLIYFKLGGKIPEKGINE